MVSSTISWAALSLVSLKLAAWVEAAPHEGNYPRGSLDSHRERYSDAFSIGRRTPVNESTDTSQTYTGVAYWGVQNGKAGACGVVHSDSDLIAAIQTNTYGDPWSVSSQCFKYIEVKDTTNGNSIQVQIADVCYGESCGTDDTHNLVLSTGAYDQLGGDQDAGHIDISWSFTGTSGDSSDGNGGENSWADTTGSDVITVGTENQNTEGQKWVSSPETGDVTSSESANNYANTDTAVNTWDSSASSSSTQWWTPGSSDTSQSTTQWWTSGSSEAATTSAGSGTGSSGGNGPFTGKGTYYLPAGGTGYCGTTLQNTDMIAAVGSPRCNQKVKITNPIGSSGQPLELTIMDKCASCVGSDNIDLSQSAFALITDLSQGTFQATWEYID